MNGPKFKIEKCKEGWRVVGIGGRTIYFDSCYAKCVGVFDFLTEWGGVKE